MNTKKEVYRPPPLVFVFSLVGFGFGVASGALGFGVAGFVGAGAGVGFGAGLVVGFGATGLGVVGAGVGFGATGFGATGAGVGFGATGFGVVGAGVGFGATGFGATGAGVGFGATGAGAGVGFGATGFGATGAGVGAGLGVSGLGADGTGVFTFAGELKLSSLPSACLFPFGLVMMPSPPVPSYVTKYMSVKVPQSFVTVMVRLLRPGIRLISARILPRLLLKPVSSSPFIESVTVMLLV